MHVRTKHPVSLYIPGKSRPEAPNDRLIHLVWKSNEKTGRVAHSSRCLPVPMWQPQLTGKDDTFLAMLVEAFEDRQNKIAHRYVTAVLDAGDVCNDVPAELLEPEVVLADFLDEQEKDGSRGKLNKDQITTWFDTVLRPFVEVRIAENNNWTDPTEEQYKKIKQTANGYRATLEKLAAPKPTIEIKLAEQLQRALSLLPDEHKDIVCKKLESKVERIINAKDEVITLEML